MRRAVGAPMAASPTGLPEKQLEATRVLLADDHADFLAAAVRLLSAEFEVVRTFGDGESLLREAAGLRPDLIVLDVTMPGVNGIETARRLKAAGGAAAVVFLTVHSDPDYVREALAAGGLGYVVKCRLASDLIPALKEALAGRSYISPSIRWENSGEDAV